jgi:DNA mismatch endonuclease, patch repair protein
MSRLGRRDTKPELEIRRLLHAAGLRFRVDHAPVTGLRTRADVVFIRQRVALYVDGCFWHRCPEHFVIPKSNTAWWLEKIARNVERDQATTAALEVRGWTVLRAWEHEEPSAVASRVIARLA